MTADLHISPELTLPLDAVTETFALIAKRRVGKSNAAVVMAEQMYDAGIPWVAVDPKGDWWGVRSSRDGKHDGLSVVVFGGEHEDVPLLPDSGAYMADLVANQRLTCVLDVSQFTKADEVKFLYAFATRLLKVNRDPLHIFFEECDDYIPQSLVRGEIGGVSEAQLVRAFSKLVRHGGFRGIGCTLITQRPALVNNNVLSQTETMMLLRTTMPTDVETVGKWVKGHPQAKEILESLPTLKVGEAWVVSPAFLELVQRITFGLRRTFDSAATPKMGEKRREPTRLADVDLAAIKEQMAETIEKAKEADPKELRKRIKELERQVASSEAKKEEPVVETVEVPVLSQEDARALADVGRQVLELSDRTTSMATTFTTAIDGIMERFSDRPDLPRARPARDRAHAVADRQGHGAVNAGVAARRRAAIGGAQERPAAPSQREPRRTAVPGVEGAEGLGKGELATLTAIAQTAAGVTREQLTVLTGYKRSSRNTYLQRLASRDLVDVAGERITVTDAGFDALGPDFEPLPTGTALQDHWLAKLSGGEREILAILVDAYPSSVTREDLSETTGYKRSSRNTYLQRLKARDLIVVDGELVAASGDLFDGEP
jgi:uncharacterized protein